jgi:hypothetical protein
MLRVVMTDHGPREKKQVAVKINIMPLLRRIIEKARKWKKKK